MEVIDREARDSQDGLETGGILLGHEVGDVLEVTVAGSPGPAAIQRPTRFRRDLTHAQQLSDDAFKTDGSIWLGEWHTHPEGPATPSELDHQSYAEMLADTELGFVQFLCFIVTPGQNAWGMPRLWPWIVRPGGFVYAATVEVTSRGKTPDDVERGTP